MINKNPPFLREIEKKSEAKNKKDYPYNTELMFNFDKFEFQKPVTIFVGENGSGKTTLLKLIAKNCNFNPGGGSRSHLVPNRDHEKIDDSTLKFSWSLKVTNGFFMRADNFYNFANYVDDLAEESGKGAYKPYGNKSLHQRSHGEAFLALFDNRFSSKGIYILDEPEAALSPQRQLTLLSLLINMSRSGLHQIIIATHSPIIMALPDADLVCLENGQLIRASYTQTDHYKITKMFLSNPEGVIRKLTDED